MLAAEERIWPRVAEPLERPVRTPQRERESSSQTDPLTLRDLLPDAVAQRRPASGDRTLAVTDSSRSSGRDEQAQPRCPGIVVSPTFPGAAAYERWTKVQVAAQCEAVRDPAIGSVLSALAPPRV